MLTNQIL